MLIHRVTRRLNDEYVHAANIFQQLEVDLAIGESLRLGFAQRNSDMLGNLLCQRPVRRAAEKLESLVVPRAARFAFSRRRPLPRPVEPCHRANEKV